MPLNHRTRWSLMLLASLALAGCSGDEAPAKSGAKRPRPPEMVRLPAGSFQMGAASDEADSADDERPLHTVQLQAFYLGRFEVTVAEFAAFVADSGYRAGSSCWTYEARPPRWRNAPAATGKTRLCPRAATIRRCASAGKTPMPISAG
ncbi:formylglycine-generating enzyme family protein [Methylogaea oryzae]|uniref:formylglycine-generating enzyme family protein n=1 Tax=Methylogaea oryzae TaxID=1295382 RepID=UPI0012E29821|nr:SUMF1/EgtB/PvdO family nonheme iron enzyme [Methylogaea oryzae]